MPHPGQDPAQELGQDLGQDLGHLLSWPLKDPRWPSRLLLTGLLWFGLLLVPFAGVVVASVNLYGWMLVAHDNLHEGRLELPPPGLRYLRRGLRLFMVELVYFMVLILVSGALLGGGVLLSLQRAPDGSAPHVVIGLFLSVLGQSVLLLASTLWVAITPAVVVLTEREGAGAALDLRRLARMLRAGPRGAVLAGLVSLLCLDVIAPLGALACLVGLVLTVPYGYAVLAAAVEWYERTEQTASRR